MARQRAAKARADTSHCIAIGNLALRSRGAAESASHSCLHPSAPVDSFLLSVFIRYTFFPPISDPNARLCHRPPRPHRAAFPGRRAAHGRSPCDRRRGDRHCSARPHPSQPRPPPRTPVGLGSARRRHRHPSRGLLRRRRHGRTRGVDRHRQHRRRRLLAASSGAAEQPSSRTASTSSGPRRDSTRSAPPTSSSAREAFHFSY